MKQTTLLSYFKKPNTSNTSNISNSINIEEEEEVYKYFYLVWDKKKPKIQAHFLKEKPQLITFKTTFIYEKNEMTLCGYFPFSIFKADKERKYKNVGFLKSLLQKAIRKSNPNIAVKCAYHYILLDLQDFLRRLPIIIIEDTTIHEVYPTLIWLMIASTKEGFEFSKEIYEYLMGIVYVIAQIPYYHEYKLLENENNKNIKISKNSIIKDLVYSLNIRKAYGGMKCDLIMLENYANMWNELNSENKYLSKMNIRPILLESIGTLELNEWIIEAIDFHCAPQILTYIKEEYDEYDEEYIKKLIWHYSSKINVRRENKVEDISINDWNKIKKYVYRVQHYLLEENY